MSDTRTLIDSIYGAFARGDAAFVLGSFHEDIEWNEAEGSPLAAGNPYDSPQAVGEGVFGTLLTTFRDFAAEPSTMIVEGDTAVALGRYTGVHNESGEALDAPFAHVWWVKDGKVARFQQYTDTEQHARIMG